MAPTLSGFADGGAATQDEAALARVKRAADLQRAQCDADSLADQLADVRLKADSLAEQLADVRLKALPFSEALLELVRDAAAAAGSAQPAQVGTAFKNLHGQTFEERRKDLKLPRKQTLARYIEGLELTETHGPPADHALLELVRAAVDDSGSAQPAQVGTAFKKLHGQTYDECRKGLKLPRKPLAHYIGKIESGRKNRQKTRKEAGKGAQMQKCKAVKKKLTPTLEEKAAQAQLQQRQAVIQRKRREELEELELERARFMPSTTKLSVDRAGFAPKESPSSNTVMRGFTRHTGGTMQIPVASYTSSFNKLCSSGGDDGISIGGGGGSGGGYGSQFHGGGSGRYGQPPSEHKTLPFSGGGQTIGKQDSQQQDPRQQDPRHQAAEAAAARAKSASPCKQPSASPDQTTNMMKSSAKRKTIAPLRPWNAPPMDCIEQPRYKPAAPSGVTEPPQPTSRVQGMIDVEVHSSLQDEWHPVAARISPKHNADGYTTVSRSFADLLDLVDADGFPKFISRMTVNRDSEYRVIIPKVQLQVSGETWMTELAVSDDAEEELIIGDRDFRSMQRSGCVTVLVCTAASACDEGVPPGEPPTDNSVPDM
jgi:hypothetical protein